VIHAEGVIHNDLKPENFVCIGARLKLIDFGIANRIEAEKTSIERDIRCGTINYMAPETIEANDVSDCFKVAYTLATPPGSSHLTSSLPLPLVGWSSK
jgi:serine/threonine protein kinase